MQDGYEVSIKVEDPDGEQWEQLFWIVKNDRKLVMKEVEKMNADQERKIDWNPAKEIAFGLISEGLRQLRREEERKRWSEQSFL